MEEINESIKHILSFLHVVQTSVHDYRQSLSQAYQKEYRAFVEDWKKANKQKKQVLSSEVKPKVQSEAELKQPINIEELDHADQLLEKARRIRKQVSEKQHESNIKLLSSKGKHDRATKKISSHTEKEGEITSAKLKSNDHSCAGRTCKKPTCPEKQPKVLLGHQRNIHASSAAKPLKSSKEQASTSHKTTDKTVVSVRSKPLSHLHTAIVSKETFLSLKNLHIADAAFNSPQLTISDSKGNNALNPSTPKAGVFEVTISQTHLPTQREFHKVLNDRFKEQKHSFKLDKKWAWYTFLSSKDEVHISRAISCKSYEDWKKAHLLLTALQESMFWLDFFYLIKKEICPHLQKLDKNERCTIQVIQCLKNICSADYRPYALVHLN